MLSSRSVVHHALLTSAFAFAFCATGADAKPQYTLIHTFAGAPSDGAISYADVQLDAAGNIYGTTHNGGAHDVGSIYKIATDGTLTLLHSFALGDNLGYNPYGGVTIDKSTGDLYGTTEFGGPSDAGVIWKLTAGGTYSVLHAFDDTHDGRQPRWHLVPDRRGNLYGVALFGGANNAGTVFRYGHNGRFTLLHTFSGSDGNNPVGKLDRDKGGTLYGVTFSGGAHNWGTAYKISPSGKFTSLYSFTNGSDGGFPEGGVQHDEAGNLYGTNASGGSTSLGTVFELAPSGKLTTLYSFTGGKDGGAPFGDLLRTRSGKLYGTNSMYGGGDCQNGCGTVFEINATGKFRVLHHFAGGTVDGGQLDAGVTMGKHGVLYGATPYYGNSSSYGVVFSVDPK